MTNNGHFCPNWRKKPCVFVSVGAYNAVHFSVLFTHLLCDILTSTNKKRRKRSLDLSQKGQNSICVGPYFTSNQIFKSKLILKYTFASDFLYTFNGFEFFKKKARNAKPDLQTRALTTIPIMTRLEKRPTWQVVYRVEKLE